jgi:hypothetical protein
VKKNKFSLGRDVLLHGSKTGPRKKQQEQCRPGKKIALSRTRLSGVFTTEKETNFFSGDVNFRGGSGKKVG